jgi:hypothetical protein
MLKFWFPACAGMTKELKTLSLTYFLFYIDFNLRLKSLDSRLRGNDGRAFAGMTNE